MKSRSWISLLLPMAAGLLASVLQAELVVFPSGHILKVEEVRVEGERIILRLPAQGMLSLPLLQIERIVADEIVIEPPAPLPPTVDTVLADRSTVPATPFGELIFETARRYEMSPRLVAAVVQAESAFDPRAVSPKGASGLMQLMPATALRFGLEADEIFEPARNLEAGTRYLGWLWQRFDGDLAKMLAGYNAGEAMVDRYKGVPPFRETRGYIDKIYSLLGLPAESGDGK